jgi:predicted transposase YdaD
MELVGMSFLSPEEREEAEQRGMLKGRLEGRIEGRIEGRAEGWLEFLKELYGTNPDTAVQLARKQGIDISMLTAGNEVKGLV